ncbi:hypothetical protein [Streptomyces sp. P5_D11]
MIEEDLGEGHTVRLVDHGHTEQLAEVDGDQREHRAEDRQHGVAAADLARGEADEETDTHGRVADLVLGGADDPAVDAGGDEGGDDRGEQP